jgi:excisionase family DNA binding protein
MEKLLLKITEAAEMAGIGRSLAYQFVHTGQWPSVKIRGALRIPLRGLEQWIAAREQEADARAAWLRGDNP